MPAFVFGGDADATAVPADTTDATTVDASAPSETDRVMAKKSASPTLFKFCASGKHLPEVVL